MKKNYSRREFLKSIPQSGVAIWAGATGFAGLFSCSVPSAAYAAPAPPPNRPFNMVTLGDSIMWGQGLPEGMKFRTIIEQWLRTQFQGSRQVHQIPTHAHSGAVTGLGAYPKETHNQDPDTYYARNQGYPYPGEIPSSYPSISRQIGMTVSDLPAFNLTAQDIDLVLLDGGINDVQVFNILNVTDITTNAQWVRKITRQSCVGHMTSLLPQVLTSFPNAAVVITGYFPIVSHSTDIRQLAQLLKFHGVRLLLGLPPMLKGALVDRCNAFADEALTGLTGLINQTNSSFTTPRVALAWPAFSDDHCYAAPNRYLFLAGELDADEDRGRRWQSPPGDWATPQGIAYYRGEECSKYAPHEPGCYDACTGHPNPAGARAYADAIISQLQHTLRERVGLASPPPPPRTMVVRIVDRGSQQLQGSRGTETWNWIVVTARDAQSGAPLNGATASVTIPGGGATHHGPAGLDYYRGPIGQKIYYLCTAKEIPLSETRERIVPCTLGVSAQGYMEGRLTLPPKFE